MERMDVVNSVPLSEILLELMKGIDNPTEIAKKRGVARAGVSGHLQKLAMINFVKKVGKKGKYNLYEVNVFEIIKACEKVRLVDLQLRADARWPNKEGEIKNEVFVDVDSYVRIFKREPVLMQCFIDYAISPIVNMACRRLSIIYMTFLEEFSRKDDLPKELMQIRKRYKELEKLPTFLDIVLKGKA